MGTTSIFHGLTYSVLKRLQSSTLETCVSVILHMQSGTWPTSQIINMSKAPHVANFQLAATCKRHKPLECDFNVCVRVYGLKMPKMSPELQIWHIISKFQASDAKVSNRFWGCYSDSFVNGVGASTHIETQRIDCSKDIHAIIFPSLRNEKKISKSGNNHPKQWIGVKKRSRYFIWPVLGPQISWFT